MQTFAVQRVERDQVAATYPLIREVIPDMDRAAWLKFARRATAPGAANRNGIMIARDRDSPFPSGLFCYRTTLDPKHLMVLWADHFIALHVLDPAPVVDALIAELDELAKRLDCSAVRSVVHTGGSDVAGRLIRAGHVIEGAQFCKVLRGPEPATSTPPFLFAIPNGM
jgi:hypothetical protein